MEGWRLRTQERGCIGGGAGGEALLSQGHALHTPLFVDRGEGGRAAEVGQVGSVVLRQAQGAIGARR